MDVFDLQAKITLDSSGFRKGLDDASGVMSGFKNTLEDIGRTIATVFAVDKVSDFVRGVTEEYGRFEQLVGGVDALFGEDSGKKLKENAAKAFETAGLSGNEYMDTATSFAASLIQELGGDTDEAVALVDKAITDMSDNANTMGSDIGSIQNAYKGFAKDNYTMLDNLKLGYGGTKSEMARLINDTGVLGDTMVTVSTMTEKGNFEEVVSLEAVIEAVHAKQEELKITGRTAEEAFGTIEGSLNTLKAAWSNWKVGLGDENADLSGLTDNLLGSFETVVENVVPVVEQIGESLTTVFSDLTGIDLTPVTETFNGLKTSLSEIGTAFSEGGLSGGFEALIAQIEQLTGLDLSGVTETLTGLSEAFAGIGDAFADGGISGGIDAIVQAFGELTGIDLSGLTSGIKEFLGEILNVDSSTLTSIGGAVESLIGAFSGVDLAGIVSGAATAVGEFFGAFDEAGETVISFVAEIVGQLARDFNDMAPGVAGAAAGIGIFAGGLALMQAFQGIPALLSGISAAFSALNTVMAANPILLVVSLLGALATSLITAYNTSEDFRNSVDQLWSSIKEGASTALENLKTTFGNIGKEISDAASAIKERVSEFMQAGRDLIQGLIDGISEKISSIGTAVKDAAGKVVDWFDEKFDRHSPSKVFAEMGRDLMRGLVVGIDDEAGSVQRTIDSLRFDPPTIRTSGINVSDSTMGKLSAAAINNAIGLAHDGGGNGQPAVVNLVVDGRTMAQVLFDPLSGVAKQKGVPVGGW